jgi:hypothetical protein
MPSLVRQSVRERGNSILWRSRTRIYRALKLFTNPDILIKKEAAPLSHQSAAPHQAFLNSQPVFCTLAHEAEACGPEAKAELSDKDCPNPRALKAIS